MLLSYVLSMLTPATALWQVQVRLAHPRGTRSSAQLKSVVLKSRPSSDDCVLHPFLTPLTASHRRERLNAKAIETISALPTLLLAKSAILHAWAFDMNQRQCLYARSERLVVEEEPRMRRMTTL